MRRHRSARDRVASAAHNAWDAVKALRTHLVTSQPRRLRIDPLTGALGAWGFIDAYDRLTYPEHRDGTVRLGLIVVNLDQAPATRDLFGLEIGQLMLTAAFERIRSATEGKVVVARPFGDEFAILAPYRQTKVLAHRIADALAAPAIVDGIPLDLVGPVGVALRPEHGTHLLTLIPNAHEGARTALQMGKAVGVYEPRWTGEAAQRVELVRELQRTLADPMLRHEIEVLYQPQVSVATGALDKVEALLRWKNPRLGEINPQQLIDAVEPTAVMHTLTGRIIEDVIAQLAAWTEQNVHVRAAINVSMRDLSHHDSVVDRVSRALDHHGVPCGQVELEVTEGTIVSDAARTSEVVSQLAAAGVPVSVDDFGTGYASLLYLRSLPVAGLKIDRGLVQRIAVNHQDRAIVRTIVDLGAALGLSVVAEGVEDLATHEVLADLNCPTAQGWLYAPPMSAAQLMTWLRDADRHSHARI